MITLITAVPGSGKTLYSIGLIIKALEEGRQVYHNINGLKVDKFPNNHNLHDAPKDWRDTPHGSLVIYDECQQEGLYPATAQRGIVSDERITSMEIHRHSGHDLVFITQAPTFVHHHVRKLVGRHIHLYRAHGIKGAAIYEWSHTCDSPNDRREQERSISTVWKFPTSHFEYYQSATIHTHKFRIPWKILILVLSIILAFIFFFSFLNSDKFLLNDEFLNDSGYKAASAEVLAPAPPTVVSPKPYDYLIAVEEAVPLGGCIASESRNKCNCYSKDGVTLNMPVSQCFSIINNPLPRTIISSGSSKSRKS